MEFKQLMTIHAVFGIALGVLFVLLPGSMLSLLGVATLGTAGGELARLVGAALLGFGLLTWQMKEMEPLDSAGRAVMLALSAFYGVSFLVTLFGQFGGAFNTLGWLLLLIFLAFAIGFGTKLREA